MTRARSWLLALAVLSLLASKPLLAVSPSYVMFYGSPLSAPVVQRLYPAPEFEFLWSPFTSGRRGKALRKIRDLLGALERDTDEARSGLPARTTVSPNRVGPRRGRADGCHHGPVRRRSP
jgi:hypothetical protein